MNLVDIINPIQWFSGCILLILASFGFKYREEEIARGLVGFLLFGSLWCFCVAFQLHPKDLGTKVLINKFKLLAIFPLPYLVLKISLSFLEEKSKARQILKHLWVIPAMYIAINFSPYHYLINTNYFVNPETGLLHFSNGKLFGLHYAVARIIVVCSFIIMWNGSVDKHLYHRKTATLIILAILIPFIIDTTVVNILPELRFYQLVPVGFMVTGVIIVYAIFSHRSLETIPYERSKIIDDLKTPCLMWGKNNELVDCNQAGGELFNINKTLQIPDKRLSEDLKSDGKEIRIGDRFYRITYSEIRKNGHSKSGGYTILTDVTESRNSESELKRVSRLKTDVLGVISHDMGGMLGLLSLNADVLFHNFKKLSDDNKMAIAEKICEQAREINRFSSDLVEWSKDQFGQESFVKQEVFVFDVISCVAEEVRSLAEMKKQTINFIIDKTETILTNSKLLEIIVRNLVLNAIKHGEVESEIRVEYANKEIKIINKGEFKDSERLNLFFIDQEKNTYSGLGLKICKEFCQILDCWIEFEVLRNKTIAKIKGV